MGFCEMMKFLVVDADKANVKYLKIALQYLGCEVMACRYKEQALSLLLEQKQGFDIVLVDVDIPYEMGFEFVEIVSSKMNIPIIMMCSAIDNEIIAAGMKFSACQIVLKPVGFDDVQRFLQCALEHRRQHLLEVGNSARNSERLNDQQNGSNQGTIEGKLHQNRLVWTEDLNALFVEAVQALGGKDMAAPKKIMELMNVPNLTRENIASHLQKYRLYSDPNYRGGKRKRKASQAMQVNEQALVVAHPNRCVISFEAPEFAPNAKNASTEQQHGQIEGTSRRYRRMNSDSTQVNGMAGYGNQQGAYLEESQIAQFLDMSEQETWQQMYSSPNVKPYVPEPPAESVMMQGMAVPEVFGDRPWSSLPAQSWLALQVPSDGIRSEQTPTSRDLDPELESFLAMDLSDPNFPFLDVYPPQDMSMIYGGLSNGLHDNISSMGGIVDNSNTPGQQHVRFQQEQIRGTPQEQPWSLSGQGTSEPPMFGQGTRNSYFWFGPKPPGTTFSHHYNKIDY